LGDGRAVESFLEMLSAERGASRNTLDAYSRDLENYRQFLKARKKRVLKTSVDDLRAYLAGVEAEGVAASTAARRLSALRQFHKFLYAEGYRADDPTAILDSPRLNRPLPKILSVDEVDRLLGLARDEVDHARLPLDRLRAARMHCLMELLYATG